MTTTSEVTLGSALHPRAATRALVHGNRRPRLSWHQEIITCLLGTWLLCGLYMDGWAHQNETKLDSLTTPWHGLFYGGFVALAAWILWHLRYHHDQGHVSLSAIPEGYGGAIVGLVIFFVGATGDQVWHLTLGIERDLTAFLSPTHLLLVVGMIFMVSAPLRAAWSDPALVAPGMRRFLPALWSLTLTFMVVMVIYQYLAIFPSDLPSIDEGALVTGFPADASQEQVKKLLGVYNSRFQVQGLAMIHLTDFMLMIPILLALRRWRTLPFGSVTLLFTAIVASVLVPYQYNKGWTLVSAVVGGLLADVLVQWLRPTSTRVWAFRAFAFLAPVGLWTSYFVVLQIAYGIGWPIELSTGVIVLTAFSTLGIAYLLAPSPIPGEPAAAGSSSAREVTA